MIPTHIDISRLHPTWIELIPKKNFDTLSENDESAEQYVQRVQYNYGNIPTEVLKQWHYWHIFNEAMIANYAWIDYSKVRFSEVLWTHQQLAEVQIYSDFEDYFKSKASTETFSDFTGLAEDKIYWKEYGTWRVPIIILNTTNIVAVPTYSELNKPYQLVEGHTRFGYYHAFYRLSQLRQFKMPEQHKVFLMDVA